MNNGGDRKRRTGLKEENSLDRERDEDIHCIE